MRQSSADIGEQVLWLPSSTHSPQESAESSSYLSSRLSNPIIPNGDNFVHGFMKIRHATVGLDRNFLNTIPMIAARWAGDGLLKRSQQVGLGRIYVLAGGDTAGPGDLVRMLDLATGRPRVSSPLADSGLTIARVSTPEG
jgi:hypothetical protein